MEKVAVDEIEPMERADADRRGLTEPLGATDLAINHYHLEPGERFSGGLHTHMDQEEVFVVFEGEATFETTDDPVTVGPGEAVRFAPGEYQSGRNDGEEPVVALALGAPKGSEDVRIPRACPECANDNLRVIPTDDGFDAVCPDCGAEVAMDG